MPPVQILVTGEVKGKLGRLFKRVETVNAKNGPFAAVFCVGEFFPSEAEKDAEGVDIAKYITGEATAPLPTYFLGGADPDGLLKVMSDQSELCTNITYLGKHGIATLHGLNIGFLSGLFADEDGEDNSLKAQDTADAKRKMVTEFALTTSSPEFGGVDALFTNQWPRGITAATNPGPARKPDTASGTIAVAAAMLRPRYHFAGSEAMAWSRTPYRSQAALHVTRFVALGPVILTKGEKFLHALKLSPMAEMSQAELEAAPPACTRDPFASISAGLLPTGGVKRGAPGAAGGDSKRLAAGGGDDRPTQEGRIYVANISYQATEEQLAEFFGAIGPVKQVSIAKSQEDGRPRGFAHISFTNAEDASRAIQELNDAEFLGRKVGVRPATVRQNAAGGGRSGWYESGPPNQQEGGSINTCWFCLANPKADIQLVAAIGTTCYIALDKGALSWGPAPHVLVIPIDHHSSTASVPVATMAEMEDHVAALRACFASLGKQVCDLCVLLSRFPSSQWAFGLTVLGELLQLVGFERNLAGRQPGGSHSFLNCVGVDDAAASATKAAFIAAAKRAGFEFECEIPAEGSVGERQAALSEAVGKGEFCAVTLPDGGRLVHAIPKGERHSMNFGREVLAGLLGEPERANWQECKL